MTGATEGVHQQTGENKMKDLPTCADCGGQIREKYFMGAAGKSWHSKCLKCVVCHDVLDDKCYCRNEQIYCKNDFLRIYGIKCNGCWQTISKTDLVRKAGNYVFHVGCFSCATCRKPLVTGEEMFAMGAGRFLCKEDYLLSQKEHEDDSEDEGIESLDNTSDHSTITSPSASEKEFNFSEASPKPDINNEIKNAHLEEASTTSIASNTTSNNSTKTFHLQNNFHKQRSAMTTTTSVISGQIQTTTVTSKIEEPNKTMHKSETNDIDSVMDSDEDSNDSFKEDSTANKEQDDRVASNIAGARKRGPRTTIKAKQLDSLKEQFGLTPKPNRAVREQLAERTGLSMRVIQVWFQNRRSKERRLKQIAPLMERARYFRDPRALSRLYPGMYCTQEIDGVPAPNVAFGYEAPYDPDSTEQVYPGNGFHGYVPHRTSCDTNNVPYNFPGLGMQNSSSNFTQSLHNATHPHTQGTVMPHLPTQFEPQGMNLPHDVVMS